MAQVRHGPWSFGSPALAHDPMRQRVQFHQKAQRKGQYGNTPHLKQLDCKGQHQGQASTVQLAECRQLILPHVCHPLIAHDGKPAHSSPSLDLAERKAAAQSALATAGMAQPAFIPDSWKQPPQRVRTALDPYGEGLVSLWHERKKLKASSCAHAAGYKKGRNIT